MKFSTKDLFSKFDQFCSLLRIWLHLRKKYFMKNFIYCVVIFGKGNWVLPPHNYIEMLLTAFAKKCYDKRFIGNISLTVSRNILKIPTLLPVSRIHICYFFTRK